MGRAGTGEGEGARMTIAPKAPAASDLAGLYEDLHMHPELSFQERRTAAIVADQLRGFGYQTATGVGCTGVVGILRNGEGRTALLRVGMDGLPVAEQTGLGCLPPAKTLACSPPPPAHRVCSGCLVAPTPGSSPPPAALPTSSTRRKHSPPTTRRSTHPSSSPPSASSSPPWLPQRRPGCWRWPGRRWAMSRVTLVSDVPAHLPWLR